jgi:hypothetical protein
MNAIHQLQRALRDEYVLSVYIAADEHDPAQRSNWRSRLAANLNAIETSLSAEARPLFASAREHVDARLEAFRGFLPGHAWAVFAAVEGVHLACELPVSIPDLVRWRRGPVLGAFLQAITQEREILVVLVDSRRARLLRYQSGRLTTYLDHQADGFIDDLSDRHTSKRAATTTGIRGVTATDAADRIRRRDTQRLLRLVTDSILNHDAQASIIIGGPDAPAAALATMLRESRAGTAFVEPSLHVAMSAAEIQAILEPVASSLTRAMHSEVLQDVLDLARGHERGVLGLLPTSAAGELGQIELLLLTPRMLKAHEDDAEALIARAFDIGGAVDILVGEAAARLDDIAGGVAARLRFAVAPALQRVEARQA